jgi:two-component system, NtrC family, response regulator HydG
MEKKTGCILIADDNAQILHSLKLLLKNEFAEILLTRDPAQIPGLIQCNTIDIILLDMNFSSGDNSGIEGLNWLSEVIKIDPFMVVIMITAYGDIDLAVNAIKRGATDFISKPWDAEKLIITLKNALKLRISGNEVKRLQNQQQQIIEDSEKQYRLFRGVSPVMDKIYKTVEKVAHTDANILILGENGTGKELIAREIHRKSARASGIFLPVDMGSISESLFESEMFGHVKGAFTDARDDRAGRFEIASGGTIFMDEITNLSVPAQAKLLGVLQNQQITRLGSAKPIDIDFRLIAATNKNPEALVQENLFREDLLFRINTILIELPPLRERRADIPGLADYFLGQYAAKYEKQHLKMIGATYEALVNNYWSGNIRELKHTIEKAVILCDSRIIKPEDLNLRRVSQVICEPVDFASLSDIEKNAISRVLQKCQGNITQAARILDISRTTLYAKMKEYGL